MGFSLIFHAFRPGEDLPGVRNARFGVAFRLLGLGAHMDLYGTMSNEQFKARMAT